MGQLMGTSGEFQSTGIKNVIIVYERVEKNCIAVVRFQIIV